VRNLFKREKIMTNLTMQMFGRALAVIVAMLGLAMTGCGGGGGAGPAPEAVAPAPSTPVSPGTPGTTGGGTTSPLGVTATLDQGVYLEFLATTSATSSTAEGTSTNNDHGVFRLTLGAPTQVAGVAGYAVVVSGKTLVGGHEFRPPWTFISQVGTRWLGSTDGATLLTLFDPALPAGTTGFFLGAPATRRLSAAPGRFDGAYNAYSGVSLFDASSDGGCQWVAQVSICSDSSTTFSQKEVLLDGIGPVGYSRRIGYITGGSAAQVIQNTLTLELVGTSLVARDGSAVRPPPWRESTAMPVARYNAKAVALGARIYLFGGVSDDPAFDGRRVDVFDVQSRTWQRAPDAPLSLAVWQATAEGSRIALFGGSEGLLFDPGTGRWTATARHSASGTITGVGSRTRPDGTAEVIAISDPGSFYLDATLLRYMPSSNSWETLGLFRRGQRDNYAAVMVGDSFLLIGGFANGGYISTVTSVDITTRQVKSMSGHLGVAVVSPAVALHGGRVVVAGGHNYGGTRRSVQFVDPATGQVSEGPELLGELEGAAAATAEGTLVLFGGKTGTARPATSNAVWVFER
jgi:Kelch motif